MPNVNVPPISGIRFIALPLSCPVLDTYGRVSNCNFEWLDGPRDQDGAFADTMAIIDNLDLVIAPDSVYVHLAATMGKTTWTLINRVADWRWLLDRDDSPWYPNMKLFRQSKLGNWDDVMDRVTKEL